MAYALAIHTTSPELGLALSNFADDSRCQTWELGREMSTHLHTHLQAFLYPQTWADLTFLAVAKGPGGFTGTRLGVVTARTLAQQLNVPLFAISTLAAFALSKSAGFMADSPRPTQDIAVQMPAQQGDLFVAIYSIRHPLSTSQNLDDRWSSRGEITDLFPDTVLNPTQWEQVLKTWRRPYQLISMEGNLGCSASSLLEIAYWDWQQGIRPTWSTALPFYGQLSVAKPG